MRSYEKYDEGRYHIFGNPSNLYESLIHNQQHLFRTRRRAEADASARVQAGEVLATVFERLCPEATQYYTTVLLILYVLYDSMMI